VRAVKNVAAAIPQVAKLLTYSRLAATREDQLMKRLAAVAIAASLFAVSTSAATQVANFRGHELSGRAKITLDQARAIALKARPGRITDQELEKEHGGSGLRYSFDVVSHGKTIEVGVDAVTGKVLENGAESPAKEAKEAVKEGAEPKH
jgi:uncharacterized membrane protein YkoI